MKGIILYVSTYGATRQFAEWISEETGFPAVDFKRRGSLRKYDIILFGTSVKGGKLRMAKWISKKWPLLEKKRFSIFLTGGANRFASEFFKECVDRSLPDHIIEKLRYYPVGGRYDITMMRGMDKFMINLALKMVRDEQTRAGILRKNEDVRKENLAPYLDYVRSQV